MPPRVFVSKKIEESSSSPDTISETQIALDANDEKINNNIDHVQPNQVEVPGKADKPEKWPDIVKPPNHLDAVPLERDGSLNQNYMKEILLDIKADNEVVLDKNNMEKQDRWIEEIFSKIDVNNNGRVTQEELKNHIYSNILRHVNEAANESRKAFDIIDANKDGFATWEEYHYHFLVDNKLMDAEMAKHHDENSHDDIGAEAQEKMEKEMRQWYQSDKHPKDNLLTPEEFLGFRHPEHSKVGLNEMTREIFEQLDKIDLDHRLSEAEFVNAVPIDKIDNQIDQDYIKDRHKEFDEADTDKDGFLDFQELLGYLNPASPRHAISEADGLIKAADDNADGVLDLKEMKRHGNFFLGSGVANVDGLMHDEF